MSAIIDHLISEPATYFTLNQRGKLAARSPAILDALTHAELAELKTYTEALTFILCEEGVTSPETSPGNGQTPGGTGPFPAENPSRSSPEGVPDAPVPALESQRDRRSTSDPVAHPHPDIWEVIVVPRAGGGPGRIVTRRTRDEVRERARREFGSVFGY